MTQVEKIEALALLFEEDASAITPETKLDDLIFDSVAKMALVALLSEKFDRNVSLSEFKLLKSIQDVLDLMKE
jgi:acyl carrier protein